MPSDKQLATVHALYDKHKPVYVGKAYHCGDPYNQYACSCGYMFWDSYTFGSLRKHVPNGNLAWEQELVRFYGTLGLEKEIRAFLRRLGTSEDPYAKGSLP
jgi:hypothetical protein